MFWFSGARIQQPLHPREIRPLNAPRMLSVLEILRFSYVSLTFTPRAVALETPVPVFQEQGWDRNGNEGAGRRWPLIPALRRQGEVDL